MVTKNQLMSLSSDRLVRAVKISGDWHMLLTPYFSMKDLVWKIDCSYNKAMWERFEKLYNPSRSYSKLQDAHKAIDEFVMVVEPKAEEIEPQKILQFEVGDFIVGLVMGLIVVIGTIVFLRTLYGS